MTKFLKNLKWAFEKPVYKAGDEVWVISAIIGQSKVNKTAVRKVPVNICYDDELRWDGWYDISLLTFPGDYLPPSWIYHWYVFNNEKDAKKAAKWYSVDFTDEEWLKCIGDRKIPHDLPGSIENCELVIGCVNDGTSDIRDLLIGCKENKGLMEIDRQRLENYINNCYNRPESLDNPKSLMSSLLKQLKIKWSKNETVS